MVCFYYKLLVFCGERHSNSQAVTANTRATRLFGAVDRSSGYALPVDGSWPVAFLTYCGAAGDAAEGASELRARARVCVIVIFSIRQSSFRRLPYCRMETLKCNVMCMVTWGGGALANLADAVPGVRGWGQGDRLNDWGSEGALLADTTLPIIIFWMLEGYGQWPP
jgi:hypothetical protein